MSLARVVITAVIMEGRSKSEVARDYGVSRVWVQRLVHRYRREGPAAFEPRSRRPHSNPRAVSLDLEDQVIRLRKELSKKGLDAGAETIAVHLQIAGVDSVPAVSTIWRILSRRGFVSPQPQKRPRSSWKTFCAEQPNERWQADITHWRLADGTEVEILNILNDHSRVCIASVARRITTGTQVWASFAAAFDRWAIPASVLTDNGAVFTGKQRGQGRVALEVQLGLRGIRLHHSRPYHPQTCGKVERFHQTQKKWLAAQPKPATVAGLQRQLDRFGRYYNTVRPHRALGRRTPAQAYAARPKAVPTGPIIPTHYRVRTDRIDSGGSVTLRHNSRLHHIGLGARLAGTPIMLLIDDLHIRIIERHTGTLIRELILDPTRDYQPRGLPPGPPKGSAATPRPASRSRPDAPPAAGVKAGRRPPEATRRAPALTPARTAPPSPAGMPKQPQKCNDVSRHLLTMSRDITRCSGDRI
jgi:transposase InsO family protein